MAHRLVVAFVQHPQGLGDATTVRIIEFFQSHPSIKCMPFSSGSAEAEELRYATSQTRRGVLVVVLLYSLMGRSFVQWSEVNPSTAQIEQALKLCQDQEVAV